MKGKLCSASHAHACQTNPALIPVVDVVTDTAVLATSSPSKHGNTTAVAEQPYQPPVCFFCRRSKSAQIAIRSAIIASTPIATPSPICAPLGQSSATSALVGTEAELLQLPELVLFSVAS